MSEIGTARKRSPYPPNVMFGGTGMMHLASSRTHAGRSSSFEVNSTGPSQSISTFGVAEPYTQSKPLSHVVLFRVRVIPQQCTTSTQPRGSANGSRRYGWTKSTPPQEPYTSSTATPGSPSGSGRRTSSPSSERTRSPRLRSKTSSNPFFRPRGPRCACEVCGRASSASSGRLQ